MYVASLLFNPFSANVAFRRQSALSVPDSQIDIEPFHLANLWRIFKFETRQMDGFGLRVHNWGPAHVFTCTIVELDPIKSATKRS
jgi:hypothetical protein